MLNISTNFKNFFFFKNKIKLKKQLYITVVGIVGLNAISLQAHDTGNINDLPPHSATSVINSFIYQDEAVKTYQYTNKYHFFEDKIYYNLYVIKEKDSILIDRQNIQNRNLANECIIDVTYDYEGGALDLSGDRNINKLLDLQNNEQRKLLREFILLHESSHCEFGLIKSPFIINDDDLSFKVNYLLKNTVNIDSRGGISEILNENFADIYALTIMIRRHGMTEDMQHFYKYVHSLRKDGFLRMARKNQVEHHCTHFAMEILMQDKHMDIILNEKSTAVEFKKMALSVANDSMIKYMGHQFNNSVGVWLSEKAIIESIINAALKMNILYFHDANDNNMRMSLNLLDIKDNTSKIYTWGKEINSLLGWNKESIFNNYGQYYITQAQIKEMKTQALPIVKNLLKQEDEGYLSVIKNYSSYIFQSSMQKQEIIYYEKEIVNLDNRFKNLSDKVTSNIDFSMKQ